jgi:Na+-transporting NADH:ubiquinone oxidoreductase subunit E
MILAQVQQAGEQSLFAALVIVFVSASLTDNILLTRFLGLCPFLSVSRQLKSAFGMGLAVAFVTTCTVALNYLLYRHVLLPLKDAYGIPAESLMLILFIVVIAGFVQLMEMVIERISIGLYYSLGIFLPLITVNCAILGASLFMVIKVGESFGVLHALVYGFGAGGGWMLAIVLMAGIRHKLRRSPIPEALEGPGITLIIAGIMAMAFIVFSGMIKT